MSATRDIAWGECLLDRRPDPEVKRRFRRATRRSGTAVLYFHPAPWLVDQLITLSARLMTRVHIDDQLADLIGLVVSQDNSCRYCFAAQRAFMRVLGFSEQRIVRLEQDLMLADLEPAVRIALDYARTLSRSSPPPGLAELERVRRAGFDDASIREIASLAALHSLFNRTSTIAALPPEGLESLPDSWWARGFRPVLAVMVRRYFMRDAPEALGDRARSGPYGFVVAALDGLPTARELRAALDAMWTSTILTRRCKAFLFAVVARALGSARCEAESLGILVEEGLDRDEASRIVDHLSWAGFTPQESVLVPFARETVWYQTPRLQQRAREVRDRLEAAEFVEAIGVLAIANAVCRLAAALAELPELR